MGWKRVRDNLGPYVVAVITVAFAMGLKELVDPFVEQELSPFLFCAAPVVITAWYGGLWPGLFCVALVGMLTTSFFTLPEYNVVLKGNVGFVRLTMFLLEGVLICVLAGAMHNARRQAQRQGVYAETAYHESQRHVEELTRTKDALLDAQAGLRRAIVEAQNANLAKSEFLANVSHELRTPLNAVIGMTDLCLQEAISDDVRENLTVARDSASMLLRLLNDLLDFSKIEAGKVELEVTPFRLREVLNETIKALSLQAHEKGLELALNVRPEAPDRLLGDSTRLEQVVSNLVSNALKFTKQGEVVVSVEIHSLSAAKVCLLFCVRDTGIGISSEDQQKIFAPFTQADSSSTRAYDGIGLGLAIASQLVEAMEGRIWLDSELNQGSKFYFTAWFELPNQNQLAAASHFDVDMSTLRDIPVLIVDDNSTNRRMLRDALRHWQMRPSLAANAEQALAKMRRGHQGRRFPLVLLDALMPGVDGFDLAQQIQNDPDLSTSTVLMLSSADKHEFSQRLVGLKVTYLEKPVSQDDLAKAILTAYAGISLDRESSYVTPLRDISNVSLNVLVVEDTVANQNLVKKLLEKRGHHVVTADNGREAIDLCYRHAFDVVVMDIQMPTMDGFQATAAIRGLEPSASPDRTSPDVPIVAMTAHATRGFEERCLAAGMDAYLSKPIDAPRLIELLESFAMEQFPAKAQAPMASTDEPPGALLESVPTANDAAPSLPLEDSLSNDVDLEGALERMDGNRELLADMANFFLEDSPDLLDRIQQGLANRQAKNVQHAAHALKGLASNFGAARTVHLAKTIEHLAGDEDLASVSKFMPELERCVEELSQSLKTISV